MANVDDKTGFRGRVESERGGRGKGERSELKRFEEKLRGLLTLGAEDKSR